jgi:hypothetical protein
MPVEEQDTSKNHLQKAVAALKSIEREASQALLDLDPAPLNDVQVADDLRRLDRALVLQEELEFALNALSEAADSGHAIEGWWPVSYPEREDIPGDQLRAALTAACEPLAILRPVPRSTDQSAQAEAARIDILQEFLVRCRRARIGAELVEVGTQERRHGRVLGHTFAPAPDPKPDDVISRRLIRTAISDPGVPVDEPKRPALVYASPAEVESLEQLREIVGEYLDEIERRVTFEVPAVPLGDVLEGLAGGAAWALHPSTRTARSFAVSRSSKQKVR